MPNRLVGRYKRMGEIGRGGFGMVEEYLDLITGETVAIKTIPPYFVQHESKRMIREVDIMRFLHNAHPHVIDFIAMFITRCQGGISAQVSNPEPYPLKLDVTGPIYEGLDDNEKAILYHDYITEEIATIKKEEGFSLHIVMPLMRGDLFYFINLLSSSSRQKQHKLDEVFLKQVAAVFAFQLIFGLDWVHKCGIVHRDLKPDNVLVRLNTANPFYSSLCVADFGLARNMQSSDTFYVCTRNYRPPEVITSAILSQLSMDIWSLGCILYEMCTCETLFKMPTALDSHGVWNGMMASSQLEIILSIVGTPTEEDILQYMPEGNAKTYLLRSMVRPSQLERLMDQRWSLPTLPEETLLWKDLIQSCLAFFPQQRPTAEELSRHELFIQYQMIVGQNIHQIETQMYTPSIPESELKSKTSQINLLLQIIHDTMAQTRPIFGEEDESEGELFLEEDVNRDYWDDIRHHTSSMPVPASATDDSKKTREKDYEEEDGSDTVYFGRPWSSNQYIGRASDASAEDLCSRSGKPMESLELPEVTSQDKCAKTTEPTHELERHGNQAPGVGSHSTQAPLQPTTPLDLSLQWDSISQKKCSPRGLHAGPSKERNQPHYPDDDDGTGEIKKGVAGGNPIGGNPKHETKPEGLRNTKDTSYEAGLEPSRPSSSQSNPAVVSSVPEKRTEEMPSASFSTFAYFLQRTGTAAIHQDPEMLENSSWSGYLHEQPYQNNTHVYSVGKSHTLQREMGHIGRRLYCEKEGGLESHRSSFSRKGLKSFFQGSVEKFLPSSDATLTPHPYPLKGKKQEPLEEEGGVSDSWQCKLISASCYDVPAVNNNTSQFHFNKPRPTATPFPKIQTSTLRARYGNLNHDDDTLQLAIESILNEMNNNRRDMAISLELRTLLSYFCALRRS
ncbi:unnamed protein product [Phytomonas sp. Hart1]|nr:unnamed protein product [Phytomonas sp. Hart1]|eukprot:CCW66468.1 unnamed protein product [Phytomonas sp. isolate Hart1]